MDNFTTIKINKNDYYLVNDIYDFDKSFFRGCNNNVRNIITKKDIERKDYIFAYKKNKELIISNAKYCKSKLYISKDWCINNVPHFDTNKNVKAEYEKLPPINYAG